MARRGEQCKAANLRAVNFILEETCPCKLYCQLWCLWAQTSRHGSTSKQQVTTKTSYPFWSHWNLNSWSWCSEQGRVSKPGSYIRLPISTFGVGVWPSLLGPESSCRAMCCHITSLCVDQGCFHSFTKIQMSEQAEFPQSLSYLQSLCETLVRVGVQVLPLRNTVRSSNISESLMLAADLLEAGIVKKWSTGRPCRAQHQSQGLAASTICLHWEFSL